MNTMKKLISGLAMAMALGACSSTRLSDAETLALYKAHAGEQVKDFQYFGQINGWTPLGDSALVVWTKPSQAYLLELTGACPDLDYAPSISVTQHMGRVSARFDDVIPMGGGTGTLRIPCRIETIRPLDVKALRASEKEMREAAAVERKS